MTIVSPIVQPIVSPIVQPILGTEVINGASFDGTTTYLTRGADLTGNVDGKLGIFAARMRFNSGDGVVQRIYWGGTGRIQVTRLATNKIRVNGSNSVGTNILRLETTSNVISTDGYVNLLISWDMAGVGQVYLNDSDDTNSAIHTNDIIDYTQANHWIGTRDTLGDKINADINFIYFNTAEYIDFSVEANRRKFFDAGGNPILDVAGDASSATGTAPIIYQAGTYDQWENNKGSGGGMTVTGALTEPLS